MTQAHSLYMDMKAHVRAVLERVLAGKGLTEDDFMPVAVEAPREEAHGDLATNAAMVLAKKVGMTPKALADMLVGPLSEHSAVAGVEVAGPGFINIRLHTAALLGQGAGILDAGAAYGTLALGQGRKALVEYVSINPTGPVHVGHGRNAVFGDAIANLLQKAGYPVNREYLVNDAGGQIRTLVRSLHARYKQLFGIEADVPADGYPGEYLIDIAEALKAKDGDKWLAVTDEDALFDGLRAFAVEACLNLIKADVETLGIHFDTYFSEYEMHTTTTAMVDAVAFLREKGLVYEGILPPPKGKEVKDYVPVEMTLFKATAFGLPEDQAIYNRAGRPTYFGQDIAYHWNKIKRGFDFLPVVIDFRQAGSYKPLLHAIETIAGRAGVYQPVPYELVNVMRNGVPVKLSKRAGNIVALKDVLEEIGKDAFRYTMLTVKPTTVMTFDLGKAVEKSMENPVFYVQYAHARLCAVFRQAEEMGIPALPNPLSDLKEDALTVEARSVLRELMLYPLVVEQAARALEPHRLTVYAGTLAAAVHRWYGASRWLEIDDVAGTHTRLTVAAAARTVLADVLGVCGVSAPERM